MKTLIFALMTAASIALLDIAYNPSAIALGISSCEASKTCTAYEKCELENLERNWPEYTGYHQDCNNLVSTKERIYEYRVPLAITGTIIVVMIGSFIVRRRIRRRHK